MSDPVSWLVIEPGWKVVDGDGEGVGEVEEAIGDRDIFSGVVVATGLFDSPRWVPAESIAEIRDQQVELTLRGDEIKQLEEYQAPERA